ncbi:MAG: cell division protein CrgA [Streptomycetales bacterium]
MPKSRIRQKSDYTPPPSRSPDKRPSPPWLAPLMVACFILGLAWIVVFYVTNGEFPVAAIGNWNMVAGFGFIAGGLALSTQWR